MIPLLPIIGTAWKILNIGSNVIFVGQLGRIAIKKYYKLKEKHDNENGEEHDIIDDEQWVYIINQYSYHNCLPPPIFSY